MSDDHDDLLFEINDGDFADGTLNEDELLLSDEDRDEFDDEPTEVTNKSDKEEDLDPTQEQSEVLSITDEPSDTGQSEKMEEEEPPASKDFPSSKEVVVVTQPSKPQQNMGPRQPFRQKFQRWPNQPPRWNHPSQQHQQQMPFPRGPNQILRPPGGHMRQNGPGQRHPGSFPPNHPQFFNNNFMQGRPPMRQPVARQRFFYPNQQPMNDPSMQGSPAYVPSPIMSNQAQPAMPRKVLINPNFKGGVEAAKNQLMKDQFFSSGSALPEDELLRKQQEFINHNMRQIEKRRHERTPSPEYRRGYSRSPSPPRHRRRGPFKSYDRRRNFADNDNKGKDENLPEEDEETRAYRQQIESQRKKREEILRQKEMRRRQLAEQKSKETQPAEPLQAIVVTDKKIVLKRKSSPDKSTTPPIKDAPVTPTRRIVLKPSKEMKGVQEVKPALADGSKRKIQKILNS